MGENSLGIRLKNKLKKIIGVGKEEKKDKKLSEDGSTPQASSDQASAAPAPSGEQKSVSRELTGRYMVLSKAWEGKKTEEGTLINNVDMISLGKEVGSGKNERELFAHAMVAFLKKFNPDEKIITDFENRITDEVINNDNSYTKLVNEILASIEAKKFVVDSNKEVSEDIRNQFSTLAERAFKLKKCDDKVNLEELKNKARYLFEPTGDNEELFAYAMLTFLGEVNKGCKKSGVDEHAYETFKDELGKLGKDDKEEYIKKAKEILDSIDALLQRANSAEVPKELVDRYKALYEKHKSQNWSYKLENPDQVIKASKQNSKRKHFVHVLTKFLEKNFDKDSQAEAKGYWEGMKEDDQNAYVDLVSRIFTSIDNAKPPEPDDPPPLSSPEGYETQPESAPTGGSLDGVSSSYDKTLQDLKNLFNSKVIFALYKGVDIESLLKEAQGDIPDKEKGNKRIEFAYAVLKYLRELTVKDDLKTDFDNDVKKCEENVKKLTGMSADGDYIREVNNVIFVIDKWLKKRAMSSGKSPAPRTNIDLGQGTNGPHDIQEPSIFRNLRVRRQKNMQKKRVKLDEPEDLELDKLGLSGGGNLAEKLASENAANPSPLNTAMNQPSQSKLPPPPFSAATGQSSESKLPPPPLNTAMNQTQKPNILPPPPLNTATNQMQKSNILPPPSTPAPTQQEGLKAADPKDFEEKLRSLIDEANEGCLFYNKYVYDEKEREDADVTIDDYTRQIYKISMNARNFLTKISEKIYGVEKSVEETKVSIRRFYANVMKYDWGRTEEKQKEVIDEIEEVVKDANEKAASLESKKRKIIDKESIRFNALVKKYCGVTGKEYEIKKDNMSNFYKSIGSFWLYHVKEELEITDSKRADKLSGVMNDIDKKINKNDENLNEIPDDERLVSLEEALDQKFNIIGRVILYLEKRKNKENEKGFFGKLFGKSKKSKDKSEGSEDQKNKEKLKEEKKQKKEKLNNQKRLKKCFEDMGEYLVKHKKENEVKLSDFKKLVKCKNSYSGWNEKLSNVLKDNTVVNYIAGEKNGKMLLMSILFFSFVKFDDENDIIAACDGLKAGGIKSTDPKSFEGKATSIRKAIKGKCATLDMVSDPKAKTNLKNDIKSLCVKYFDLSLDTLTTIEDQF